MKTCAPQPRAALDGTIPVSELLVGSFIRGDDAIATRLHKGFRAGPSRFNVRMESWLLSSLARQGSAGPGVSAAGLAPGVDAA